MTKSAYADRDTVGTIALKARQFGERGVVAGDMAHEMMPGLVADLNETIASNPFDGRPFYITIHEKKDGQLVNVMNRRMVVSHKRPYPETATQVYWTSPQTNETLFCWSLPHWSEFPNYMANAADYTKDQIKDILAYCTERLDHFGFYKVATSEEGIAIYRPIPNFKDRKMGGNHAN